MSAITLGPGGVTGWTGEGAPTSPLWLHDLVPAPGYRAAVAGLGPPPTGIVEQDARGLLGTLLP